MGIETGDKITPGNGQIFFCKTCGENFFVTRAALKNRAARGFTPKFCKRKCVRRMYMKPSAPIKKRKEYVVVSKLKESLSKRVLSLKDMPAEKQAEIKALYSTQLKAA